MTVTLNLSPALVARAEERAAHEGLTLERFINELVARDLAAREHAAREHANGDRPNGADAGPEQAPTLEMRYEDPDGRPLPFPVFYGGSGLAPGIDPLSNASLLAAADAEEDEKYIRIARGGTS